MTSTRHENQETPVFQTFRPQPPRDIEPNFTPTEAKDRPLLVKVLRKEFKKTQYKPDGTDVVFLDILDLSTGTVHRESMWSQGSQVDQLIPYVGEEPLVIRLGDIPKRSGKGTYIGVVEATESDIDLATKHWAKHGDPFAPKLATVPAGQKTEPPF